MTTVRHLLGASGRWFVPAVLALGLLAEVALYRAGLADQPIRSDGVSYYVYLPSVLLHGSPDLSALAADTYGGHFPGFTGIREWPNTSAWLNPHPIGVAMLMAPFFLVAHVLTLWSNLPPDGFSRYYQIAAAVSGLCYGAAGLWLLQRLLARHAGAGVALATVACITFGTNLFHYMTYDAGYSHAYAFFLLTALLVVTERWYESPTAATSAGLGAIAGLLVVTRHSHGVFLLVPVVYGLGVNSTAGDRLRLLQRHAASLVTAAGAAMMFIVPQLALYKAVTGFWFTTGYALHPQVLDLWHPKWFQVLISPARGVFFWSPILLLSLVGVFVARRGAKRHLVATIVTLPVHTWLVASWYEFGGSFGHRGFTDVLPILALYFASTLAWLAPRPLWCRSGAALIITSLVVLSVIQMYQYWIGVIPFDGTTWDHYRSVFLRVS